MGEVTQFEEIEEMLSPQQLAEKWNLGTSTIRRMFMDEPGVMVYGDQSKKKKRQYLTIRIPLSVALRVYARRAR